MFFSEIHSSEFLSKIRLGVKVRLGQVRLGQVRLGQVRLGQVRLGQVRLGQAMLGVRLGQVRQVRLGQLGQVRKKDLLRTTPSSFYHVCTFEDQQKHFFLFLKLFFGKQSSLNSSFSIYIESNIECTLLPFIQKLH